MKHLTKFIGGLLIILYTTTALAKEEITPASIYTVGKMYSIIKKDKNATEMELFHYVRVMSFCDGIRWGLVFVIPEEKREKITRACIIERPIQVVMDNIYDNYKKGNIKSNDFIFVFINDDFFHCSAKMMERLQ